MNKGTRKGAQHQLLGKYKLNPNYFKPRMAKITTTSVSTGCRDIETLADGCWDYKMVQLIWQTVLQLSKC